MNESIVTTGAVFLASLLGSPHCAAMCGGFVTLAAGVDSKAPIRSVSFYHIGRLATYILAGFGAAQLASFFVPWVWGGVLILISILSLMEVKFVPRTVHRRMTLGYRWIVSWLPRRSMFYPVAIGFGSTFLPCGWLYLYVGAAAASPNPTLIMVIFWLGTLPILSAWFGISKLIVSSLGGYFPLLRSGLLAIAGLYAVLQHTEFPGAAAKSPPACHQNP